MDNRSEIVVSSTGLPAKADTPELARIKSDAETLLSAGLTPSGIENVPNEKRLAETLRIIFQGAKLGLDAVDSIDSFYIIPGKGKYSISPKAELIASQLRASPYYDYQLMESTDEICTIRFLRDGVKIYDESYTIEQARKAGLANKSNWQHPKLMLFYRCLSQGAKKHTPLVGKTPVSEIQIISPEELDSQVQISDDGEFYRTETFRINLEGVADLIEPRKTQPFDLLKLATEFSNYCGKDLDLYSCSVEDTVDILDLYIDSWPETPWRAPEHRHNAKNLLTAQIKEYEPDDIEGIASACSAWILKRTQAAIPWAEILANVNTYQGEFFNTPKTIAWCVNRKDAPIVIALKLIGGYLERQAGLKPSDYEGLADLAAVRELPDYFVAENWEYVARTMSSLVKYYSEHLMDQAPPAPKQKAEKGGTEGQQTSIE